jgi:DNA-binding XRE family transcriptional regulator
MTPPRDPPRNRGQRLAELRRRLPGPGTQEALAKATGYSRSTVSRAENGRNGPGRSFWTACDRVLATGGTLTWRYDRIQERRTAPPARPPRPPAGQRR